MKTYTACGSLKFEEVMKKEAILLELNLKCNVILPLFPVSTLNLNKEDIEHLGCSHFTKIAISDGIYVIDVNNYIGDSTKKEIEYAKKNGKEIIYYSKTKKGGK